MLTPSAPRHKHSKGVPQIAASMPAFLIPWRTCFCSKSTQYIMRKRQLYYRTFTQVASEGHRIPLSLPVEVTAQFLQSLGGGAQLLCSVDPAVQRGSVCPLAVAAVLHFRLRCSGAHLISEVCGSGIVMDLISYCTCCGPQCTVLTVGSPRSSCRCPAWCCAWKRQPVDGFCAFLWHIVTDRLHETTGGMARVQQLHSAT